jgi:hypothetical protein
VTQDSLVVRPATEVAESQTATSGLRRVILGGMSIGFRGGPRVSGWNALVTRAAAAGLYSEKLEIGRGEISAP